MMCRHCNGREATRARGLCWRCSFNPEIRELYPKSSHHMARRAEVQDFCGGYTLPDPCPHPPASPEKLAVLEARAAAGLSLWNPDDGPEIDLS